MKKRSFLSALGAATGLLLLRPALAAKAVLRRIRPSDKAWPAPSEWQKLNKAVGGRLIAVESPLAACIGQPASACTATMNAIKNRSSRLMQSYP